MIIKWRCGFTKQLLKSLFGYSSPDFIGTVWINCKWKKALRESVMFCWYKTNTQASKQIKIKQNNSYKAVAFLNSLPHRSGYVYHPIYCKHTVIKTTPKARLPIYSDQLFTDWLSTRFIAYCNWMMGPPQYYDQFSSDPQVVLFARCDLYSAHFSENDVAEWFLQGRSWRQIRLWAGWEWLQIATQ